MKRKLTAMLLGMLIAVSVQAENPTIAPHEHWQRAPVTDELHLADMQQRLERIERWRKSFQTQGMDYSPPDDFAEVAREHWTHSPQGILICLHEMRDGACLKRREKTTEGEYDPAPWLTPQEYLDWINPSVSVRYVSLSYYPPSNRLFLFYRILRPQALNQEENRH